MRAMTATTTATGEGRGEGEMEGSVEGEADMEREEGGRRGRGLFSGPHHSTKICIIHSNNTYFTSIPLLV